MAKYFFSSILAVAMVALLGCNDQTVTSGIDTPDTSQPGTDVPLPKDVTLVTPSTTCHTVAECKTPEILSQIAPPAAAKMSRARSTTRTPRGRRCTTIAFATASRLARRARISAS